MLLQTQGAFVCACVYAWVYVYREQKKKRERARGRERERESALAQFASLHINAELDTIMVRVHSESFSHRFQQEHSICQERKRKKKGGKSSEDLRG